MADQFDLSTTRGRLGAYAHYVWNDHAFIRLAYVNAHWISEEFARAAQPWPYHIKAWRDRGVRTLINLRGGNDSHHILETEACARYGVKLVSYPVASRDIPSREQVLGARGLFETIEYPAMMHCKSGADRAGLMSVLYMHFRKSRPIAEARRQLHPRFGHASAGLTGVLDYYFERYLSEIEPLGLSLEDWVQTPDYDPAALKRDFKAQWWGTLLTEKILRRE
jgi:protein tyrosine/serine phosphatase